MRGKLVGEGDTLAAPGNRYPWLDWEEIERIAYNPEGGYRVTPTSTITARLAEGISLTEVSYEIWGPRGDAANFHEPTQGDVDP